MCQVYNHELTTFLINVTQYKSINVLIPSTHALISVCYSVDFPKRLHGGQGCGSLPADAQTGSGRLSELLKASQSQSLESQADTAPKNSLSPSLHAPRLPAGLAKLAPPSHQLALSQWAPGMAEKVRARPELPTRSPLPQESIVTLGGHFASSHSQHAKTGSYAHSQALLRVPV